MPRAQRERQMLAVAEETFARHGYSRTSMDDIAARVGVSKPMLYAYFGSKDGLLQAIIAKFHTDLRDHVVHSRTQATSVRGMLRAGIVAYHEFVAQHVPGWAVVRDVGGRDVNARIEEIRHGQAQLVSELFAEHIIAMPPHERDAAGHLVVGACERVELWRQSRGDISARQAADLVENLVWPGLAERAAAFGVDLSVALELTSVSRRLSPPGAVRFAGKTIGER